MLCSPLNSPQSNNSAIKLNTLSSNQFTAIMIDNESHCSFFFKNRDKKEESEEKQQLTEELLNSTQISNDSMSPFVNL